MTDLDRLTAPQTSTVMTCIIAALFVAVAPARAQTPAVWQEIITVAAPGYTDGPVIWDAPGVADFTRIYNQNGVSYVAHADSTSTTALIPVTEVQGNVALTTTGVDSGASIGCLSSVTYAVQPVALPGAPPGVNFVPVSVRVRGEATALLTGISGHYRSAQGLVQQRTYQGTVHYTFQAAAGPDLGVDFDSFDETYSPSLPIAEETFFFVRAQGLATYKFGFQGPALDFHAWADPEITISNDEIPGTATPYSDVFELVYSPNLAPEPSALVLQIVSVLCLAARRRRSSSR